MSDLARVAEWRNLAQIAVGQGHIVALDRDGKVFAAGSNSSEQAKVPQEVEEHAVWIGAWSSTSNIGIFNREDWRIFVFGAAESDSKRSKGSRVFGERGRAFAANSRGELEWCDFGESNSGHFAHLRGRRSRDVRDVVADSRIAALREGEDQWRFWGDAPEGVEKFDHGFCNARASGAWKIVFSPPYVIALKPVANLTSDDWTGTPQSAEEPAAAASLAPQASGAPPAPPARTTDNPLRASKDEPFENSLGMRFVPVPGTEVLFCIHETRWRDYAVYAEANPGVDSNWRNQTHDGFTITDRPEEHPVGGVSWEDAQAFCEWLSREEGRIYRLPTDREWSIAVGIGREERWRSNTTPETVDKPEGIFPWGREWPPPAGAGNYSDESRRAKAPRDDASYLDGYDDGFPTTAPVMNFEPNPFGLYDLGGNVWEWVEDWFSGTQDRRVARGGSFYSASEPQLHSSRRELLSPDRRRRSSGFRIVLTPDSGR